MGSPVFENHNFLRHIRKDAFFLQWEEKLLSLILFRNEDDERYFHEIILETEGRNQKQNLPAKWHVGL